VNVSFQATALVWAVNCHRDVAARGLKSLGQTSYPAPARWARAALRDVLSVRRARRRRKRSIRSGALHQAIGDEDTAKRSATAAGSSLTASIPSGDPASVGT
jgi:hypothetical protein